MLNTFGGRVLQLEINQGYDVIVWYSLTPGSHSETDFQISAHPQVSHSSAICHNYLYKPT